MIIRYNLLKFVPFFRFFRQLVHKSPIIASIINFIEYQVHNNSQVHTIFFFRYHVSKKQESLFVLV